MANLFKVREIDFDGGKRTVALNPTWIDLGSIVRLRQFEEHTTIMFRCGSSCIDIHVCEHADTIATQRNENEARGG